MAKYSIGIDLGGTKIIAGVVNKETGEVVGHAKNTQKKKRAQTLLFSEFSIQLRRLFALPEFQSIKLIQ
jgi:predicted NBD/HSP70 family sugar kinase